MSLTSGNTKRAELKTVKRQISKCNVNYISMNLVVKHIFLLWCLPLHQSVPEIQMVPVHFVWRKALKTWLLL